MKTVGMALVAGLAARGVDTVFGIPGVHTIELYRGLPGSGIRHVTPRHEQGAGFMADGYARSTGRPGVAFVITGPGLTNTITAMAQAQADSVPMLVVSGVNRRPTLGRGLGHLHELPDQGAMIRTLCPSWQVTDPAMLEDMLDAAFARMATGRPGPVHIEVPVDVMPLPAAPSRAPSPLPARPRAGADVLARAVAKLTAAKSPVILAGGGARGADLRALSQTLDAPVVQTTNARGLMSGHHLSVPASPSLQAVRALIAASDQVLALGTEFGPTDYDMYATGSLPETSGMIRVDICADQLARQPAALPIRADVAGFVADLIAHLPPRTAGGGAARATDTRAAARAELGGLNPQMPAQLDMVEAIRNTLPRAIIVGDSTQPVYAGNLFYDHDRAGGWFNAATGYGALGYAPGAAVGAAIAQPDAQVVCLIGDGGLGFSPSELRTARDEGLAITYVIWNNAAFREIADAMRAVQITVIGCDPTPLDMAHFAAACGLPHLAVPNTPAALAAALAAPQTGPRMIEVVVTD